MIDIREIAKELAKQPHQEEVLAEVLRRVALAAFHKGYSQACWQMQADPPFEPAPEEAIKS